MLYLTCTTITSVDLAHYGVSRAKDWVSVDCGTNVYYCICIISCPVILQCKKKSVDFTVKYLASGYQFFYRYFTGVYL